MLLIKETKGSDKKDRKKFKKLSLKKNFELSKGRIYFKKSRSNIFITLTDANDNVIIALSSGSVLADRAKKPKISTEAVESIMNVICSYIKNLNIPTIELILRTRINIYINFILKELEIENINVSSFIVKLKRAYNGMRQRKSRR